MDIGVPKMQHRSQSKDRQCVLVFVKSCIEISYSLGNRYWWSSSAESSPVDKLEDGIDGS